MYTRCTWLWAFFLLFPSTVYGSPVDLWGYGTKGAAMGGAYSSLARDHEAVYYNPAGLAFATRPSVSLGFQNGHLNLQINDTVRSVPDAPALTIGFGLPLRLGGFMKNRLSLGLGFVLPQNSVLKASTPVPQTPQIPILEYRAQTISLQACLSLRITDWFSLGAGFLALSGLEGAVIAEPNASGVLGAEVEDALLARFAAVIGGLIRGPEGLSIAVVHRGESYAQYKLPVTADLGESFPIKIPVLDLHGTAQYDPEQWTAEASWHTSPFTVSIATTYKKWTGYHTPIHYPAIPEDWPEQPAPTLNNTWIYRSGMAWTHKLSTTQMTLRLGYIFEPTPLPQGQSFHNYLGNNRHIYSGGLGFKWEEISLNLMGQWHQLKSRSQASEPFQNLQKTEIPKTLKSTGSLWLVGGEVQIGF